MFRLKPLLMTAGLLGSLPLLMFAAFAPLARLARQLGGERMLLVGLLALIIGLLVRSEGHVATLFARTMVNRVWQYHFGRGLVDTPNDLGFSGGRPSHLPWLVATATTLALN